MEYHAMNDHQRNTVTQEAVRSNSMAIRRDLKQRSNYIESNDI